MVSIWSKFNRICILFLNKTTCSQNRTVISLPLSSVLQSHWFLSDLMVALTSLSMRKFYYKVIRPLFLKHLWKWFCFWIQNFNTLEKNAADSYLLLQQTVRRDISLASVSAIVRLSTAASTEVSLWREDQLRAGRVLHDVK